MYELRKNVKVNDFDEETREFLLEIGLSCEDNLSNMFENFLIKKHISLNDKAIINNIYADNFELEKGLIYKSKVRAVSLKGSKNRAFNSRVNGESNQIYQHYSGICTC